jgi:hypothetical protein
MKTSKRTGAVVCAIASLWGAPAIAVAPLEITGVTVDESANQTQIEVINSDNRNTLEFWLGGESMEHRQHF